MLANEAHDPILVDQIDEKFMEARVARIESDVAHIQKGLARVELEVSKLRDGLGAANDAIADVQNTVTCLDAKVDALSITTAVRIDALGMRIDANARETDAKFAALSAKVDANAAATDAKIKALAEVMNAKAKAVMWLLGILLALGIGLPIARGLHWIS